MIRWEQGRGTVEQLLSGGAIERVTPDVDGARALLQVSRRHLASAKAICENDPEGAYAALYDAARKALAALLEVQGLRVTSRGGHIALREVVSAQFSGLSGAGILTPFDRLRRRRNDIEYPGSDSAIDIDEVDEALARSVEIVDFAERLFENLPVF